MVGLPRLIRTEKGIYVLEDKTLFAPIQHTRYQSEAMCDLHEGYFPTCLPCPTLENTIRQIHTQYTHIHSLRPLGAHTQIRVIFTSTYFLAPHLTLTL